MHYASSNASRVIVSNMQSENSSLIVPLTEHLLVESELLKITKYHTTTKIGSPKLNYNFFFILQHNVIVFILLQSTADFVHLAKVTTVFCGAYIPIIPIISATDF